VTGAVDVVLVIAWLAVVGHNAYLAARGVTRANEPSRRIAGAALACGLAAGGTYLELASGGRLPAPAACTAIGAVVAVAGAVLHVGARRTLGTAWATRPDGAADLIEHGPYRVVRHPLYLGLVLLAVGTIAAHPSLPTIVGGLGLLVGLAAKIPQEERALASTFGARWDAYSRDVPRVVPRLGRRDPSTRRP
jgi:protein-S-isoprenylcysteine O-methyltransferase Ste14